MTFKDRIKNSNDPVSDVTDFFKSVMAASGMEINDSIEKIINQNQYYKIKDKLISGVRCDKLITSMIVTTAVESGIEVGSLPEIHNNVQLKLEVEDI